MAAAVLLALSGSGDRHREEATRSGTASLYLVFHSSSELALCRDNFDGVLVLDERGTSHKYSLSVHPRTITSIVGISLFSYSPLFPKYISKNGGIKSRRSL